MRDLSIYGEREGILLDGLADVRQLMTDSLAETSMKPIVHELETILGGGKMLRARLTLRVGAVTAVSRHTLLRAATAVEMVHIASLLHDDVIDGDCLRRQAPSFWVKKGVSGAILLGDLLVCKAFGLLDGVGHSHLTTMLVESAGQMCDAEAAQELLLQDSTSDWENCVDIARRKTGALFAFAGYVCGGADEQLSKALLEAGYKIGTAYQLADDILDAYGDSDCAGKTLGNDANNAKPTAVSAWRNSDIDPLKFIKQLCDSSKALLTSWPSVHKAWNEYMALDVRPVINKFVEHFFPEPVS